MNVQNGGQSVAILIKSNRSQRTVIVHLPESIKTVTELDIQVRTVSEVFLVVLSDGAFGIKTRKNAAIGIVDGAGGLRTKNGEQLLHTLSKRLDIQVQAINARKKVGIEVGLSITQYFIICRTN